MVNFPFQFHKIAQQFPLLQQIFIATHSSEICCLFSYSQFEYDFKVKRGQIKIKIEIEFHPPAHAYESSMPSKTGCDNLFNFLNDDLETQLIDIDLHALKTVDNKYC